MQRGPTLVVHIGWSPPSMGCFKLNVDGACNSDGLSTAGELIRDADGKWVQGFQRVIGCGTVLGVEYWALRDGLKLLLELNLLGAEVEVDALQAMSLLNTNPIAQHPLSSIICDYRYLIELCRVCEVCHVRHEANKWVDGLANRAFDLCN